MMSDASDMLAAALEQMDGIIAGVYFAFLDPPFSHWRTEFQTEKGICWELLLVPSILA